MTRLAPTFYKTFDIDPRAVATELEDGLSATHAHCSPKYFYNALGSTLFEAISRVRYPDLDLTHLRTGDQLPGEKVSTQRT